jgi:hypothetical protein
VAVLALPLRSVVLSQSPAASNAVTVPSKARRLQPVAVFVRIRYSSAGKAFSYRPSLLASV